jgi:hypothetical protein
MTTTTTTTVRPTPAGDLPALTAMDRAALVIGTRLILRAEHARARRAEQSARAEQARITRAEARAASMADTAFEHRATAGPTW